VKEFGKVFICKDKYGEVYATNALAQGNKLATLNELEENKWIYEKFPNSVLIVNYNA
jgi:hypothetical protein